MQFFALHHRLFQPHSRESRGWADDDVELTDETLAGEPGTPPPEANGRHWSFSTTLLSSPRQAACEAAVLGRQASCMLKMQGFGLHLIWQHGTWTSHQCRSVPGLWLIVLRPGPATSSCSASAQRGRNRLGWQRPPKWVATSEGVVIGQERGWKQQHAFGAYFHPTR